MYPIDLIPPHINSEIVKMISDGTISRYSARLLLDVYFNYYRIQYHLDKNLEIKEEWLLKFKTDFLETIDNASSD